jgi:hypothetical protein
MNVQLLITVVCLAPLLQPPPPAPLPPPPAESIELRYARAHVQLAEANLARVEQINKKVARSVPSSVVAEYEDDVTVAKTRLQQTSAGQAAGDFKPWLERAAAEQRTAEASWTVAQAVNRLAPGTFGPHEVECYRLRAQVARLQHERGQALVDADLEAQSQWKMDLLDNQVQRLNEESRRSATNIRTYPYWWW